MLNIYFLFTLLFSQLVIISPCVGMQEPGDLEMPTFARRGPTCGIRSLYVAMKSHNIDVHYENLVSKDYVGSALGSSSSELMLAARRNGVTPINVARYSYINLMYSTEPVLLHMRSSGQNVEFDHWVTFLGVSNGSARIFDPSYGYEEVGFPELVANWSGSCIIISDEKPERHTASGFSADILILIFVLAVILLFVRNTMFWMGKEKEYLPARLQITCLALAIGLTATLFHALSPVGVFHGPAAIAEVSRRYASLEFAEVDKADMKTLSATSKIIVVDARLANDFHHSHIENAINIPITTSLTQRKVALKGIPRQRPIIVYCQSRNCKFSDEIAQFLSFNGFENVSIYRNGFEDWISP